MVAAEDGKKNQGIPDMLCSFLLIRYKAIPHQNSPTSANAFLEPIPPWESEEDS